MDRGFEVKDLWQEHVCVQATGMFTRTAELVFRNASCFPVSGRDVQSRLRLCVHQ